MTGNTLEVFINDILDMGGPEKEMIFRGKTYFLETIENMEKDILELWVAELDSTENTADCICTYRFWGKDLSECFHRFATHTIFDGLNLYEAEQEIEVVFG